LTGANKQEKNRNIHSDLLFHAIKCTSFPCNKKETKQATSCFNLKSNYQLKVKVIYHKEFT